MSSSVYAGGAAARAESQRRLVQAMIAVVGRKGYRASSVADVIAQAGASRTTFYKHFDDKRDCFLAAYDLAVERVAAAVEARCDPRCPWLERTRAGLEAAVELLAAEPALGRTAIVEAAPAGAEARHRQLTALARIAHLLEAGREDKGVELPRDTGLMAVNAVAGLLFEEINAGRAGELRRRLPELLFALLVPYLGPRRAVQEMERRAA